MNLKEKTVVIDNKTYRYSKIVMLSTNAQSILSKDKYDRLYLGKYPKDESMLNQHLYFLSTDKICEGDWFLGKSKPHQATGAKELDPDFGKIIASTDLSLNLPKPSDSFLQVYIDAYNKGEKIEECLVEHEEIHYCITCNKQGVRHCAHPEECGNIIDEFRPKTTKGEITIRKVKKSWSREEVMQLFIKFKQDFLQAGNAYNEQFNNWILQNL